MEEILLILRLNHPKGDSIKHHKYDRRYNMKLCVCVDYLQYVCKASPWKGIASLRGINDTFTLINQCCVLHLRKYWAALTMDKSTLKLGNLGKLLKKGNDSQSIFSTKSDS